MRHSLALRAALATVPVCIAVAQSPVWVHRHGVPNGGSGVLDTRSGRIFTVDQSGRVYEYDRSGRQLQRPVSGPRPSERQLAAMAFDSTRGRLFLFGGWQGSARLDDTWVWDGAGWTELTGGPVPPARGDAAICYDSLRDRMVLFGGNAGGALSDTWEHDGVRWTRMPTATVPQGGAVRMSFDRARGVAVLVAFSGISSAPCTTHEWNGTDWTLVATAGPTMRHGGMTYDASRGRTVYVGGYPDADQIWEWNGTTWTQTGFGVVPARGRAIVVDDPTGGVTVLGGQETFPLGSSTGWGPYRSDRWHWDGTAMTQVHDDLLPVSRFSAGWAADYFGGPAVMFGGSAGLSVFGDTWLWDGAGWQRQVTPTAPSPRGDAAMTHRSSGAGVLLFGGFSNGNFLNDTWTWDGTSWIQAIGTGAAPSPRSNSSMATDLNAGRVILFGGAIAPLFQAGSSDNQTWLWDGTSWQRQRPATSPPGREGAGMCWDASTGTTYLFGGRTGYTAQDQRDDFWAWDGTTWRQLLPPTRPPSLFYPSLIHHVGLGTVMLTGYDLATEALQTWTWDGFDWTLADSVPTPQQYFGGRAVFQTNSFEPTIYDGLGVGQRTTQPATVDALGPGCGSPAPRLVARTRPRFGEPLFGLEAFARPGDPIVFALGTATGSLVVAPGCRVHVAGQIGTALGAANAAGFASLDVPIPASSSLIGAIGIAQAAVLSPFATGTVDLSNSLRITVGY